MHPGPINRGVEIDSEVADGLQSVILDQVTNGLACAWRFSTYAEGSRRERDTRGGSRSPSATEGQSKTRSQVATQI